MADYNRFVSYIYLYERGMKTINAGFAKVESRSGQCRINVTMKNMYHESHVKFSVYMFVRKGTRLVGIYLGDLATESNAGEFFSVTDADNIENSGYSLEQVSGMVIRGDNGKMYGTGWDDEALNVEHFVLLEDYKDIGEDQIAQSAVLIEAEEIAATESFAAEDVTSEAVISQAVASDQIIQASVEDAQEAGERFADDDESLQVWSPKDDSAANDDHKVLTAESMDSLARKLEPESDNENTSALFRPVLVKPQNSNKPTSLEKIIDKGLRMYPFEDEQVTACVRMEPQDIGMLPMKYWVFANNSFLLHGYYSYRHLIMAKMNDGRFILGVPGVNYHREQFMAGMFGFKEFKSVQNHAPTGSEFGYWYVEVNES